MARPLKPWQQRGPEHSIQSRYIHDERVFGANRGGYRDFSAYRELVLTAPALWGQFRHMTFHQTSMELANQTLREKLDASRLVYQHYFYSELHSYSLSCADYWQQKESQPLVLKIEQAKVVVAGLENEFEWAWLVSVPEYENRHFTFESEDIECMERVLAYDMWSYDACPRAHSLADDKVKNLRLVAPRPGGKKSARAQNRRHCTHYVTAVADGNEQFRTSELIEKLMDEGPREDSESFKHIMKEGGYSLRLPESAYALATRDITFPGFVKYLCASLADLRDEPDATRFNTRLLELRPALVNAWNNGARSRAMVEYSKWVEWSMRPDADHLPVAGTPSKGGAKGKNPKGKSAPPELGMHRGVELRARSPTPGAFSMKRSAYGTGMSSAEWVENKRRESEAESGEWKPTGRAWSPQSHTTYWSEGPSKGGPPRRGESLGPSRGRKEWRDDMMVRSRSPRGDGGKGRGRQGGDSSGVTLTPAPGVQELSPLDSEYKVATYYQWRGGSSGTVQRPDWFECKNLDVAFPPMLGERAIGGLRMLANSVFLAFLPPLQFNLDDVRSRPCLANLELQHGQFNSNYWDHNCFSSEACPYPVFHKLCVWVQRRTRDDSEVYPVFEWRGDSMAFESTSKEYKRRFLSTPLQEGEVVVHLLRKKTSERPAETIMVTHEWLAKEGLLLVKPKKDDRPACGCEPCKSCDGAEYCTDACCWNGKHCKLCLCWKTSAWKDCCCFTDLRLPREAELLDPGAEHSSASPTEEEAKVIEQKGETERLWGDLWRDSAKQCGVFEKEVKRKLEVRKLVRLMPGSYPVHWLGNPLVMRLDWKPYLEQAKVTDFLAYEAAPREAYTRRDSQTIEDWTAAEESRFAKSYCGDLLFGKPSPKDVLNAGRPVPEPKWKMPEDVKEGAISENGKQRGLESRIRVHAEAKHRIWTEEREESLRAASSTGEAGKSDVGKAAKDAWDSDTESGMAVAVPFQTMKDELSDNLEFGLPVNDCVRVVSRTSDRVPSSQVPWRDRGQKFEAGLASDCLLDRVVNCPPRLAYDDMTLRVLHLCFWTAKSSDKVALFLREWQKVCFPDDLAVWPKGTPNPYSESLGVMSKTDRPSLVSVREGYRRKIFKHMLLRSGIVPNGVNRIHATELRQYIDFFAASEATIIPIWMTICNTIQGRQEAEARLGEDGLRVIIHWEILSTAQVKIDFPYLTEMVDYVENLAPPGVLDNKCDDELTEVQSRLDACPYNTKIVSLLNAGGQWCGGLNVVVFDVNYQYANLCRRTMWWNSQARLLKSEDRFWTALINDGKVTSGDVYEVMVWTSPVAIRAAHMRKSGPPMFRVFQEDLLDAGLVARAVMYANTMFFGRPAENHLRLPESLDYGDGYLGILLTAAFQSRKPGHVRDEYLKLGANIRAHLQMFFIGRNELWKRWSFLKAKWEMGTLRSIELEPRVAGGKSEVVSAVPTSTGVGPIAAYTVSSGKGICAVVRRLLPTERELCGSESVENDGGVVGHSMDAVNQYYPELQEKLASALRCAKTMKGCHQRGVVRVGPLVQVQSWNGGAPATFVCVRYGYDYGVDSPLGDVTFFEDLVRRDADDHLVDSEVRYVVHSGNSSSIARWIGVTDGTPGPGCNTWSNEIAALQGGGTMVPDHARVFTMTTTSGGAVTDPRLLFGHMGYPLELAADASGWTNQRALFDLGALAGAHGDTLVFEAVYGNAHEKAETGCEFFASKINQNKGVHYDPRAETMRYIPLDTIYSQKVANALKRRAWLVPPHNVQVRMLLIRAENFDGFCKGVRESYDQKTSMQKLVRDWDPRAAAPEQDITFTQGVRWSSKFPHTS